MSILACFVQDEGMNKRIKLEIKTVINLEYLLQNHEKNNDNRFPM